LFIDPPLRPSKEGNFRYSIFFNLLVLLYEDKEKKFIVG
jgi:hypothetical protein